MTRLLGVLLLVLVLYGILMGAFDFARSMANHQALARRLGFYGVVTLGVGVLIVAGGIDLSIGSLVGLGAVAFGLLLERGMSPLPAALVVVGAAPLVGLAHGLLVTRLRLQPFLVTLCGLFIYRGLARWISPGSVGLAPGAAREFRAQVEWLQRLLVEGRALAVPNGLVLLLLLAGVLALLLHGSVYG